MRTLLLAALLGGAVSTSAFAQDEAPAPPPIPKPAPTAYVSVAAGMAGSSSHSYDLPTTPAARMEGDLSASGAFSAAWGMPFGENFRGEIEFGFTQHSLDGEVIVPPSTSLGTTSGHVQFRALNMNLYYDFPTNGPFRPYVGAGLGPVGVKLDDGVFDDTGPGLSMQAIAGGSYAVSDRVSIFAEARYQRVSADMEITGATTIEQELVISNAAGYVGLRFYY